MSRVGVLVVCTLLPFSATAGRIAGIAVSAQTGEPLASVELTLSPVRSQDEQQQRRRRRGPSPAALSARTALDGRFVLEEVEPGDYVLGASKAGYEGGARKPLRITLDDNSPASSVRIELNRSPSLSGRVTDVDGDPLPDARVELRAWAMSDGRRVLRPARGAQADDLGRYRIYDVTPGLYLLYLHPTTLGAMPGGVLHETLPVYFPQGANPAEAVKLDLDWGRDLEGMDLTARPASGTLVSGTVLQPDGAVCEPCSVTILDPGGLPAAATRLSQAGRFAVHGLPPGEYRFVSRAPRGGDLAVETVYLAEDRPVEIALQLVPGQPVSGALVAFESNDAEPVRFDRAGVQLTPAEGNFAGQRVGERAAADGAFSFSSAPPGSYRLQVSGLPANGYVRRVSMGGRELPGGNLQITGGGPVAGLEVEVALDGGAVQGQAMAEDGESPAPPDGMALLIPLDPDTPERARIAGYSGSDGAFRFRGVPPGEYLLFASGRNAAWDWSDPALLADLERRAGRVEVDANQTVEAGAPFLTGPGR